jgi:hypothetical protein
MPEDTHSDDEPEFDHDRGDEFDPEQAAATDAAGLSDADDAPVDQVERDDTPPADVVEAAERLTRRARDAVDDSEAAAYRADRDERLADHDYTARVREDDTRDVLVLHPQAWVEEGTIHTERIDDIDRGIERPLSGPGEADDWETVDDHNRDLVDAVRERHGTVHGDNAAALADFMSNHYAKPIDSATREELREFLDEYFPRNAWPTDEQRAVVEQSVRLVFEAADERCPLA